MRRTFADARRWMQQGTALLAKEADLDDDALDAPSSLPGWSRGHLLAHIAANADALVRCPRMRVGSC
ncbi:maleylpyruvate isomerase N-terminal domain-containing protein [Pseudofrankia sp. BMG5.37]|nr:maleylpyruvate isomerase N-terminal domain-containing protein [Pseudofrankia sp. BMG5.37]MDT3445810.1 maleylpyruvate isomerase N-terminal domain-containing protein [Pseudofrankia sp. BMG5.37]